MICHRIAERTFCYDGLLLPLCARCTGLYFAITISVVLTIVAARARPHMFSLIRRIKPPASLILIAIMPLEVLLESLDIWRGSNFVRFATGIFFGLGIIITLVPLLATFADAVRTGYRRFTLPARRLTRPAFGLSLLAAVSLSCLPQEYLLLMDNVAFIPVISTSSMTVRILRNDYSEGRRLTIPPGTRGMAMIALSDTESAYFPDRLKTQLTDQYDEHFVNTLNSTDPRSTVLAAFLLKDLLDNPDLLAESDCVTMGRDSWVFVTVESTWMRGIRGLLKRTLKIEPSVFYRNTMVTLNTDSPAVVAEVFFAALPIGSDTGFERETGRKLYLLSSPSLRDEVQRILGSESDPTFWRRSERISEVFRSQFNPTIPGGDTGFIRRKIMRIVRYDGVVEVTMRWTRELTTITTRRNKEGWEDRESTTREIGSAESILRLEHDSEWGWLVTSGSVMGKSDIVAP